MRNIFDKNYGRSVGLVFKREYFRRGGVVKGKLLAIIKIKDCTTYTK